jgi:hypothetical protein
MRIGFSMCVAILAVLFLCVNCSGSTLSPAVIIGNGSTQAELTGGTGSSPGITMDVSPSVSPAGPGSPPKGAIITGQVFSGPPGSNEQPLQGVSVELFCSAAAVSPGVTDGAVKTNASGYFTFYVSDQCNFYTIVLSTEGVVIHAESSSGVVIGGNQIRLASPPMGTVTGGNNFWVAPASPVPTATAPASTASGIILGAVVIVLVGGLVMLVAVLWRRRYHGNECER